jgi:hypothetical protein
VSANRTSSYGRLNKNTYAEGHLPSWVFLWNSKFGLPTMGQMLFFLSMMRSQTALRQIPVDNMLPDCFLA